MSPLLFLSSCWNTTSYYPWPKTIDRNIHHPVMFTSLGVILLMPIGLFVACFLGFSSKTQVYTALETIEANFRWVPPLIGGL
jgi:hypothetical protein